MNRHALCTDTYLDFAHHTVEEANEQDSLLEFELEQAQRWGLGSALGAQLLGQVFADLLATQQWQGSAEVLKAWREALLEHMAHGEVRDRLVVRLQMMRRHLRWCSPARPAGVVLWARAPGARRPGSDGRSACPLGQGLRRDPRGLSRGARCASPVGLRQGGDAPEVRA